MIVVDASAMVEALIGHDVHDDLLTALADQDLAAPHLLDIEVLSVLRRLVLAGRLTAGEADAARADHFALTIVRHDAAPFADRIWALRHQYTSYDAAYVALAEALDAPLYTCDGKLDGAGHDAEIRLMPRSR